MNKYEMKFGVYEENGVEKNFNFYTDIPYVKKIQFVNDVTQSIVTDTGYNCIVKDLLFDFEIVRMFTDIDMSEIEDTSDAITFIENFFNNTNVLYILGTNIDAKILEELNHAVNRNIAYLTGIKDDEINTAIIKLINTIDNKISSFDIDTESVVNAAQKISSISGEIDMKKLLDAYAETDMFKNKITK